MTIDEIYEVLVTLCKGLDLSKTEDRLRVAELIWASQDARAHAVSLVAAQRARKELT